MSGQFGHGRNLRRQLAANAAVRGRAERGASPGFHGVRSPVPQADLSHRGTPATGIYGAYGSPAATGAYGSPGSGLGSAQGSIGQASPSGINLGQGPPAFDS